jgi:hypothetical protein
MKIRNYFVSNSSSSSFVILKDSLSKTQLDMILNYQTYIESFINLDEENWKDAKVDKSEKELYQSGEYYEQRNNRLKYLFQYFDSDPWTIKDHDDYIFGETSMDNFDIASFFNYINIENDYIKWDDGWIDEPIKSQLDFIKKMKQEYRKKKINKLDGKK